MTEQQRIRMMGRFHQKRIDLTRRGLRDSPNYDLYKTIVTMLSYGASVLTIARRSARFHADQGRTA